MAVNGQLRHSMRRSPVCAGRAAVAAPRGPPFWVPSALVGIWVINRLKIWFLGYFLESFGRPYGLFDEVNLGLSCEMDGSSLPEYPKPGASSVRIGRTSFSQSFRVREDAFGEAEGHLSFVFMGSSRLLHTSCSPPAKSGLVACGNVSAEDRSTFTWLSLVRMPARRCTISSTLSLGMLPWLVVDAVIDLGLVTPPGGRAGRGQVGSCPCRADSKIQLIPAHRIPVG